MLQIYQPIYLFRYYKNVMNVNIVAHNTTEREIHKPK